MDITGNRYGMLEVIEQHGFTEKNKYGQRHSIWYCKCECGNYVERTIDVLKKGKSSCGCKQIKNLQNMSLKNKTHNMSKTRLYRIYKGMINRCYYKSCERYKAYGGRGINICDEWKNDNKSFFKWALENGYSESLTIDRINNDLGYCPNNCRWVTNEQQYKNKRQNIMITYSGITLCASDWSKKTGINAQTIRWRYKKGWDVEKIFNTLPDPYKESVMK